MPKQLSDERQAAELAKLLQEIARDLGAGILATDLPAPFKKARDLCTMLDHGWTPTSGVYDADHPAVRFFKKRYGVNVTGHSFSGASVNPCPPDVQTARVRAVRALLWRLQERAPHDYKAEVADLAKLLTLADTLRPTAKAPDGAGKEEVGGGAQVPWSDNAPEYLPNSEAVKLAEGRLEVKELYRLLTPDGAIHYMRKGHRGKVHLQDFRRYLTNHPDLESDITELPAELVDKALSGIATRKAEIDKQRRAK